MVSFLKIHLQRPDFWVSAVRRARNITHGQRVLQSGSIASSFGTWFSSLAFPSPCRPTRFRSRLFSPYIVRQPVEQATLLDEFNSTHEP